MPIRFFATPTFMIHVTDGIGSYVTQENTAASNAKDLDLRLHLKSGAVASDVLLDELRDDGGFTHLVMEPGGDYVEIGAVYRTFTKDTVPKQEIEVGHPYELSAVYYPTDETVYPGYAGNRYHGFHAIVTAAKWPLVTVLVKSVGEDEYKEVEFDRSDPVLSDVGAKVQDLPVNWTPITVDSVEKDEGVLYLSPVAMDLWGLRVPKIPKTLEGDDGPGPTETDESNRPALAVPGSQPPPLPTLLPCEVCHLLDPSPKAGKTEGHPPLPRRSRHPRRRSIDDRPWTTLNVSGFAPITGLIAVQALLTEGKRLALVRDLPGLLGVLRQAAACGPRRARRRVDLVAHSGKRQCFLRLGHTYIDTSDPAVVDVLRTIERERLLPRLGIQEVRLVGCSTSRTDEARATIRTMQEILRVDVGGVCDLLTLGEFTPASFKRETDDVDVKCPVFEWPTGPGPRFDAVIAQSRHAVRAPETVVLRDTAPPSLLRPGSELVSLIGGGPGMRLDGVLAEPLVHVIVVPATLDGTYRSFDVLLDYRLVALYVGPEQTPMFFHVEHPCELEAWLREAACADHDGWPGLSKYTHRKP